MEWGNQVWENGNGGIGIGIGNGSAGTMGMGKKRTGEWKYGGRYEKMENGNGSAKQQFECGVWLRKLIFTLIPPYQSRLVPDAIRHFHLPAGNAAGARCRTKG